MPVARIKRKNIPSKYAASNGRSYFTKRIVTNRARMAGRIAAARAMNLMGFIVVSENGQIVRKYQNGQIEVLSEI